MVDISAAPNDAEQGLGHIRDDRFSVVYSNWIQGARSPWDITLAFGHVREADPNKVAIVDLVSVVMTPQLAKALIGTLVSTVKEYELENGEISVPETIKRAAEERTAKKASLSPSTSPSSSASPSPEVPEDEA
jgi:hypothetical protein